ncbi:unnamed protein product [Gongylonema pulchrum]|uniref:Expressed conserved protein n=1 Tax=Gongylonema pulchrum TaxID=637853 RepID=A0A183EFZ7_9BILA|nr:unnamed protein product [Gongylonema pulchrum]
MSYRRGGGGMQQKWDAKKMTMKKFVYYDNDVASRYDETDDDAQDSESRFFRYIPRMPQYGGRSSRGWTRDGSRDHVSVKVHLDNRRDRQLLRGSGGGSSATAVVMNQIKVIEHFFLLPVIVLSTRTFTILCTFRGLLSPKLF